MKIIRTPEGKLRSVGAIDPGSVFESSGRVCLRVNRLSDGPSPTGVDLSNGSLLFLPMWTEVRELEAHVEIGK